MNPDSSFSRPDAALVALRPTVVTEAAPAAAGSAPSVGDFLHLTLRPVLKLQNDLLLAAVADFVADHHIPLAKASPADQQRLLTELLGRNTKLRYTLVGLITGFFTREEYGFYRQHRGEVNRRLHELAQRRVLDQTGRVVELTAANSNS
ncbi:MAG TPA: hypothetical protein VF630_11535 [Hymenobacter sp.]|jgi:hypothetical protein